MGDFCCLTSLPAKRVRIGPIVTEVVINQHEASECSEWHSSLVQPMVGCLSRVCNSFIEPMISKGITRAVACAMHAYFVQVRQHELFH